ncbi:MAG: UTP--glucose-1-phosphate uridylyltransferase [Acidobacteria bacterium]|nr:UTP--glucose-1-phosphate uridylyltransferase [Acidobacteriota bacterium]
MRSHNLPEEAVKAFKLHLQRLLCGESGFLSREHIEPIHDLPTGDGLDVYRATGEKMVRHVALIKLNGGLGTSMGLSRAKSLIPVKNGLTFLDLIVRQTLWLREKAGAPVPLVFMNSFRTDRDTLELLERYKGLKLDGFPLSFVQHRVPKILESTMTPAVHDKDPELEWCPPGHGDLYTSLATSGMLGRFLDRGITYAFVSNADNLGAVMDPALLGYMARTGADFMIEVARRSEVDRKGGHLCRLKDGRIALREAAQTPPDERDEFQDTQLYRYFNTNNIWIHLPTLKDLLSRHGNVLPLTTIVNRKTLDPRDPSSPKVIQLETAMGAAVSLFPKAAAIHVSRARFSPVKTTNDLLAVRSDAYELAPDFRVVLATKAQTPPRIDLDRRFYTRIDQFEERFPAGSPSLRSCSSFVVHGNVFFGSNVVALGRVRIEAGDDPVTIPAHTRLEGTLTFRSSEPGRSATHLYQT